MLASLRAAAAQDAPVLGVACGSLGALTAVAADQIADALDRVWAGDWTRAVAARAGRSARRTRPTTGPPTTSWSSAAAPASWSPTSPSTTSSTRALAGDGLVVATALGSSAYSMAAGGPVLAAGTAAFVCTPLAMHGGSAPPLVVPGDAVVTVDVHPGFAGFDVEVDGREREGRERRFRLALHRDKLTLVTFEAPAVASRACASGG